MRPDMAASMRHSCAVVVPIYRKPTLTEKFSLDCLRSVLGSHPKFLLKPRSLPHQEEGFLNCPFDDDWFASTKTYGLMMASPQILERFKEFKFILIYQLDCLVFRDDLLHWCEQGYDFCCAACFAGSMPWVAEDFVGVGGFSLRNVDHSLRLLRSVFATQDSAKSHEQNLLKSGQEDVWWGCYASMIDASFSVVPIAESLAFAFNSNPLAYLKRGARMPPFGCHGWCTLGALFVYYRHLPFREPLRFFKVLPVALLIFWRSIGFRLGKLWATGA